MSFITITTSLCGQNAPPGLAFEKQFGGSATDVGIATAVDSTGNVWVVGTTTSVDFPVVNALQLHLGGSPLRFTTDGGKTWSSPSMPEATLCAGGSAAPGGTLYAGAASGMYKSADSGKTWTKLVGIQGPVTAISADPANSGSLLAVTGSGLYLSSNAGQTFKNPISVPIANLARSPGKPSEILATGGGLTYQSLDGGSTWNQLSGAPLNVFAFAADPSNANIWYASVPYDNSPLNSDGIYKSVDNGLTWIRLTGADATALAVSASGIFALAPGLIVSRDGGATWAASTLAAPVTQVATDPNNPQNVYASDTQVHMSTDGGVHWSVLSPVRQGINSLAVLPGSPSAFFISLATSQNLFVSKWSADGKQMLFSTYLGGSYLDFPSGIAVDRLGNVYVAGYTYSNDFPVTSGAYQTKTSAAYSPFVAKITSDGGSLAYSTYLSGSAYDAAFGIAVDSSGSAYVTGAAGSADFPVTSGTIDLHGGDQCTPASANAPEVSFGRYAIFATKLAPDGRSLIYSGLAAGSCGEQGESIAVDSAGNAFIAGTTLSTDFPVSSNALQATTSPGISTGFLIKLSPQGSLLYSTFIGGVFGSAADGVAVDSSGRPYLTGCSQGFDGEKFTVVFNDIVLSWPGSPPFVAPGVTSHCAGAAYALKLSASGTSRDYLTYLGGAYGDGSAIALDGSGHAWISGYELADQPAAYPFPLLQPFAAWTTNGFVSELSADDGSLVFSSNSDAYGNVALDASGNAYVTGGIAPAVPFNSELTAVLGPALAELPSAAVLTRINGSVPTEVTIATLTPAGFADPIDDAQQGVAPGELILINGSGLGPSQAVGAQVSNGRIPTSIAGTTVTFDGIETPLISVQANQIVCVVPFATGSVSPTTTLQVVSNGSTSNSVLVQTQRAQVEILGVLNQDGTENSQTHPAAPGSAVTVYASGFGQTDPPTTDGQVNAAGKTTPITGSIEVSFGLITGADVLYAGPAPGQIAGISQINFRVPNLNPGLYTVLVGSGLLDVNGNPIIDGFGNPLYAGTIGFFVGQ